MPTSKIVAMGKEEEEEEEEEEEGKEAGGLSGRALHRSRAACRYSRTCTKESSASTTQVEH
jgi:hypothetical protein